MSGTVASLLQRCAQNKSLTFSCGQYRLYSRISRPPPRLVSWPRRSSSNGNPELIGGRVPYSQRQSSTEMVDFRLLGAQINSLLRANELTVRIPEFDGRGLNPVLRFESNQLPANTPNEDRRSAATCLQTKGMLFGVFDGHSGHACAQALSERLFYYVAGALMPQRSLEKIENAMENARPVPPILQWYKHHQDYSSQESASLYADHLRVFVQELLGNEEHGDGMDPCEAMAYAFRRLDADISLEAQIPLDTDLMRSTAIQVAFAGSTACVAHVGTEGIHVANAGDCRAVLGVQEEDGSWSALPLSRDHNAQNEAELARIRAQHPKAEEATVVQGKRLLGVLMPFRGFGDVRFKWSKELQQMVLENGCDLDCLEVSQYGLANYHTPPYLEATPEVTYHRLRPKDRFLILASDGLWDMLSEAEAVQLAGEHLTGMHLQAPVTAGESRMKLGQMHGLLQSRCAAPALDHNSATHLIRHAVGTNEYGELDQERLSAMLSLPDDLTRMYRDDITVTVVYFNSDLPRARED